MHLRAPTLHVTACRSYLSATPCTGTFCISGRRPCMSARHFHQSVTLFAILRFFYSNISIYVVQGMSLLQLGPPILQVRTSSPLDRDTAYYFTLLYYDFKTHFYLVQGTSFLHVGPPNLHVRLPFLPVGHTIYSFIIFFTNSCLVGSGRNLLHFGPPRSSTSPSP